jgi:hypothetical protein
MNRSDQIGELMGALAKAQAEFTFAAKDSKNPAFGSSYADLASNIGAVRPALSKHGIAFLQFDESDVERQTASVTTSLHFGEQWISITAEAPAVGLKGFNVQSLGAAWTYLRRYTLQALCGLASDDDDGNSLAVENAPMAKKKAAAPAKAAEPAPQTGIRSQFFGKAKEYGWGLGDIKEFMKRAYPEAQGSTANLTEEQIAEALTLMAEHKPEVVLQPAVQ